jgi:hypothetical protein
VSDSFDTGDVVAYAPPRTFAAFNFAADDMVIDKDGKLQPLGWPRRYYATFLLAETDNGGFPDW